MGFPKLSLSRKSFPSSFKGSFFNTVFATHGVGADIDIAGQQTHEGFGAHATSGESVDHCRSLAPQYATLQRSRILS